MFLLPYSLKVTAPTPVTTTLRFSKLTVSSLPLCGIAIWPRVTSKHETRGDGADRVGPAIMAVGSSTGPVDHHGGCDPMTFGYIT